MRYHRYRPDQKPSGTYECPNYKYKKCGGTHSIAQDTLKEIVGNVLHTQLELFCDYKKLVELLENPTVMTAQQREYKDELKSLEVKIRSKQGKRERLYEDFTDGILSAEDYQVMKQKFNEEYQTMTTRYNALQVMQHKLKKSLSGENNWLLHMQMFQNKHEINEEILNALVDRIVIHQDGKERKVEVVLKYREDFQLLKSAYEEMMGGEQG